MQTQQPNRQRKLLTAGIALFALIGASAVAAAGSATARSVPRPEASLTDATAQPAGLFIAVSPIRVLDTRPPPLGPIGVPSAAKLGANASMNLQLAGEGKAIPANATSAMLNITIDDDASAQSYLTVWPTGEVRPLTSANNALPTLIASNSMLAKLGTNGSISIYNQQGTVNVVIDLVGYMVPLSSAQGAASAYNNTPPPVTVTSPTATSVPIPFNTPGPAHGSVTRTNPTTFTVSNSGLYTIDYHLAFTTTAVAGSISVFVNGTPNGQSSTLTSASTSVADTVLVNAAAGDTIELRFTPTVGSSLIIANSSIVVEQTTTT